MESIVFVGPAYPYRGGIASFNHQLAYNFLEAGIKCRIETFTLQYPSFLFPGKTQYSDSDPITDIDITRSLNSVNPISWIRLGMKLRREAPDVIFLRYWTPYLAPALSTVARIAKGNGKSKIIALADNIIAHEPHFYDRALTSYFVGSVDGFVVMSKEVEEDLHKFNIGTKPIVCSPHPIYDNYGAKVTRDVAAEALGLDVNDSYALFFGLIRDYKGLDILLEAWAELDATPNHKLIVAGEFYSDREKYIELIKKLGIGSSVILHDRFIEDDMVKHYFSLADVVVQPYKSATQSGITQIAYNFDLPMIVTKVGGLSEIVEDGVTGMVTHVSKDSVASAIARFYNQGLHKEMSQNVAKARGLFSWAAMRKAIESL